MALTRAVSHPSGLCLGRHSFLCIANLLNVVLSTESAVRARLQGAWNLQNQQFFAPAKMESFGVACFADARSVGGPPDNPLSLQVLASCSCMYRTGIATSLGCMLDSVSHLCRSVALPVPAEHVH